jgi:hypothetical protein
MIATPQSNHAAPNLPVLEVEVTGFPIHTHSRTTSRKIQLIQVFFGKCDPRVWHILFQQLV